MGGSSIFANRLPLPATGAALLVTSCQPLASLSPCRNHRRTLPSRLPVLPCDYRCPMCEGFEGNLPGSFPVKFQTGLAKNGLNRLWPLGSRKANLTRVPSTKTIICGGLFLHNRLCFFANLPGGGPPFLYHLFGGFMCFLARVH